MNQQKRRGDGGREEGKGNKGGRGMLEKLRTSIKRTKRRSLRSQFPDTDFFAGGRKFISLFLSLSLSLSLSLYHPFFFLSLSFFLSFFLHMQIEEIKRWYRLNCNQGECKIMVRVSAKKWVKWKKFFIHVLKYKLIFLSSSSFFFFLGYAYSFVFFVFFT